MTKKLQMFLMMGIVAVFLASCQSEESEIIENNDQTLTTTSSLTSLLSQVTMSDATSDNIIDSTDCFKVKLPVVVIANGQQVSINSEEDYVLIENIFNQYPDENDTIDFVFPITVVFPDYNEQTINSQTEFETFAYGCTATGPGPVFEEPISCISIVYPITIQGYSSAVQQAQTYTIDSDVELFLFLLNLSPTEYYSINYPLSVINSQNEVVTIYSNAECQQTILDAIDDCLDGNQNVCESDDILFTNLYDSIANLEGVAEATIWSAQTHEYTFSLNSDGTICNIGYISPSIGGTYTLQIIASGEGTVTGNDIVLYSGDHVFDADEMTYVTIPPVTIVANKKYILRRINTEGSTGLCKVVKRIEGIEPILPTTNGAITIHSSRYFGEGVGSVNQDYLHIPYLTFGFSVN